MLICEGCDKPEGGLYVIGCRACSLRSISRGLPYWQSRRDGRLTAAYRRQIEALGVPAAVHQEIKRMSERTQ